MQVTTVQAAEGDAVQVITALAVAEDVAQAIVAPEVEFFEAGSS